MADKKVLLVEDDKDNVMAMAVRLKSFGYELVVAHDAIAAISAARKEKPDVIVLDLGLPGGDGFVVIQRLKTNMELMLIPIIVVSARDPLANEARALAAGAEAFLQKPVDNNEFLEAIQTALARQAGLRQSAR
jgi:DNA-binding response OmpR family regulator